MLSTIQGVYIKKAEQIWNRSQRREAAQSMKFLINIDCLGTYDVEQKKQLWNSRVSNPGGGFFLNKFKMARTQNLDA